MTKAVIGLCLLSSFVGLYLSAGFKHGGWMLFFLIVPALVVGAVRCHGSER